MNAKKLFVVLGLGASLVALAYPEAPTNHAAAVAPAKIEPVAPAGIDHPAHTTVEPSTPAVVSTDITPPAEPVANLDAAGSATAQSHAAFLPTSPPNLAEQMLAEANRLGPHRTLDPALCQAAQVYADYLARMRRQGHEADGRTPEQRAALAGFTGSLLFNERLGPQYFDGVYWKRRRDFDVGEVVTFGPHDVAGAFRAFRESSQHLEVLSEDSLNVCGFGNVGTIWVGLFGRTTKEAAPLEAAPRVSILSGTTQRAPYFSPAGQSPGRAVSLQRSCPGGQCFQPQRRGLFGRRRN